MNRNRGITSEELFLFDSYYLGKGIAHCAQDEYTPKCFSDAELKEEDWFGITADNFHEYFGKELNVVEVLRLIIKDELQEKVSRNQGEF